LLISQSSSQNDICFIVSSADAQRTVEALRKSSPRTCSSKGGTHQRDPPSPSLPLSAKTCAASPASRENFSLLGNQNVNIIAIAQGSSESNISFVIEEKDVKNGSADSPPRIWPGRAGQ